MLTHDKAMQMFMPKPNIHYFIPSSFRLSVSLSLSIKVRQGWIYTHISSMCGNTSNKSTVFLVDSQHIYKPIQTNYCDSTPGLEGETL